MTWNTAVAKQSLFLDKAGEDGHNPILTGLPFVVAVRFSEEVYGVSGYVGSLSPPTTPVTFVQDITNTRLFTISGVAGTAPFNTVGAFTYIRIMFTSALTGDTTIWEKKLYIAAIPSDVVEVYNGAWAAGALQVCPQMLPIRFMNSWYDAFRIKGFGGAKYVSMFDYGTAETDSDNDQVLRVTDERIDRVHYVYLAKHYVNMQETHDFTVRFKTEQGAVSNFVDVRVRVTSRACWGFAIKDPETS